MKVFIRTDASLKIGTGHVMRCLTLAEALRQGGAAVEFICRTLNGNLCHYIECERRFKVNRLLHTEDDNRSHSDGPAHSSWLEGDWQSDAERTCQILCHAQNADWLIVDHYSLDRRWEAQVRACVARIMVIDDLADREHDCELMLDQNYFDDERRYDALVPHYCRTLLGPHFALLRPDFGIARERLVTHNEDVRTVFVSFGGTDPSNETAKALRALLSEDFADLGVVAVIGNENPHRAEIHALTQTLPKGSLHVQIENIAQLMSESDIALGAAGATSWERCCLGLPSIVLTIADNQRFIAKELAQAGAVDYVGHYSEVTTTDIASALSRLVSDSPRRQRMGEIAKQLVDGRGVDRVVRQLSAYRITVVTDKGGWLQSYIDELTSKWEAEGFVVSLRHDPRDIPPGDFAFFLSCSKIVPRTILNRNTHNLVVHASALPHGRGWSPLTWQVLEGKKEIPITLFEAVEELDSGPVYLQDIIRLNGHELVDDLRRAVASKTIELCRNFVKQFPNILSAARDQFGPSTYYPRRRPADSRLDPDKSIREQFNLLRVVDNERYPAYFDLHGRRYTIKIEAIDESE
jgi:UDP-2,4-diacetamido-2,4,6-trideoxy-beta-L-altropyranose hydrolase